MRRHPISGLRQIRPTNGLFFRKARKNGIVEHITTTDCNALKGSKGLIMRYLLFCAAMSIGFGAQADEDEDFGHVYEIDLTLRLTDYGWSQVNWHNYTVHPSPMFFDYYLSVTEAAFDIPRFLDIDLGTEVRLNSSSINNLPDEPPSVWGGTSVNFHCQLAILHCDGYWWHLEAGFDHIAFYTSDVGAQIIGGVKVGDTIRVLYNPGYRGYGFWLPPYIGTYDEELLYFEVVRSNVKFRHRAEPFETPLPASGLLLPAALLGLMGWGRRKRAAPTRNP